MMILIILVARPAILAAGHPEQDTRLAAQTGVEFKPRLGEYHYEIKWAHQRVANGIIAIREEGDHYILTADQKTTAFIDRIYRVRYRGETRIDAQALEPVESIIEEEIKTRKKVQKAEYDKASGSVMVQETRTREQPDNNEVRTYEIQSDKGIMDVFSAIFMARSFDWSIGERHEFMVFIGEKQYEVTMDCIGVSTFEIEGDKIPVWIIRPGIRKTTRDKASPIGRRTRIFIAADESKDIVKIKTNVGIGAVTLRLVKYLVE